MLAWAAIAIERAAFWLASRMLRTPGSARPPESRFTVRLVEDPTLTTRILFVPDAEDGLSEWHVLIVLYPQGAPPVALDPVGEGKGTLLSGEKAVRRAERALPWHYCVDVQTDTRRRLRPKAGEFFSCVTLARCYCNVEMPGVRTPEQLLDWLWRNRHELWEH